MLEVLKPVDYIRMHLLCDCIIDIFFFYAIAHTYEYYTNRYFAANLCI